MVSNFSKKSNLLTSVAVIFSLLAITAEPVEARSTSAKARVLKARGTRVSKVRKARVSRVRKARVSRVRAARVSKVRGGRVCRAGAGGNTPVVQQQRHAAAAIRHQAIAARHQTRAAQHITAAAVAQQQALAAQQPVAQQQALAAQLRQQREAQWQAGAPLRQQYRNAYPALEANQAMHNFVLPGPHGLPVEKYDLLRLTGDSRNLAMPNIPVDFTHVDIGYGANPSRTAQYGIGLPAAPVLHPYNMEQDTKNYMQPAFLLNAKLPQYSPDFGPEVLHRSVMDIPFANIDSFLVVQTMPWYADTAATQLQLKPQYWLNPNAPYQDPNLHTEGYNISAGIFPLGLGGQRIAGQPGNDLIENHPVSIHNGRDIHGLLHPELISSGNTLNVTALDTDRSQTFFSVVKHGNRAAITQHVLLNNNDGALFSDRLQASPNLQRLVHKVGKAKNRGLGFQDLDPADIF